MRFGMFAAAAVLVLASPAVAQTSAAPDAATVAAAETMLVAVGFDSKWSSPRSRA